jgi:hypothetical protein
MILLCLMNKFYIANMPLNTNKISFQHEKVQKKQLENNITWCIISHSTS